MNQSFRRILIGAIFFVITLVIAVLGYLSFGWSLLDAVYMVVITIFGIGYGEVQPLDTPAKKLFTMFVIIAGTSSAVYIVGGFVQMLTEGEINRALEVRRTHRTIEHLKQHVIICGFGRIGQVMAQSLAAASHPLIIVDNNPARIAKAEGLGYLTCTGSASDEEVLSLAGIERAKALATVLPDDTLNVFITLTARSLNPQLMILARGNVPSTENKLRFAGAEHVVLPTTIGAIQLANLITRPTSLGFVDQGGNPEHLNQLFGQMNTHLVELGIVPHSPWIGRSLGSVEVRGDGAFVIVGLRTQTGNLIMPPDLNQTLAAGDTVIVVGHLGDIPQFVAEENRRPQMRYRGAPV
jgi:voltage-gated potassium channel